MNGVCALLNDLPDLHLSHGTRMRLRGRKCYEMHQHPLTLYRCAPKNTSLVHCRRGDPIQHTREPTGGLSTHLAIRAQLHSTKLTVLRGLISGFALLLTSTLLPSPSPPLPRRRSYLLFGVSLRSLLPLKGTA